jgi:signal peptidase I
MSRWGGLAVLAGAGLLAAAPLLWARARYLIATVDGPSMEPALRSGDQLIVRRTKRLRNGQIAVFAFPDRPRGDPDPSRTSTVRTDRAEMNVTEGVAAGAPEPVEPAANRRRQLLIKRIVAVPGDQVSSAWAGPGLRDVSGMTVPPGFLVVLGDNRASSWDSRHYGFVPVDRFVGVMIRRVSHDRPCTSPYQLGRGSAAQSPWPRRVRTGQVPRPVVIKDVFEQNGRWCLCDLLVRSLQ